MIKVYAGMLGKGNSSFPHFGQSCSPDQTKTSPCLRATGPDGGVWDEAEPQNKHHGPGTTLQHQYTQVRGSCCKFSHWLTTVRHSYMLQLPLSAGSSGNQQLTRTTTSLWTADGSTPLH